MLFFPMVDTFDGRIFLDKHVLKGLKRKIGLVSHWERAYKASLSALCTSKGGVWVDQKKSTFVHPFLAREVSLWRSLPKIDLNLIIKGSSTEILMSSEFWYPEM